MPSETSQPLLSVCIPTFNRAEFLRQNLVSITRQFGSPKVAAEVEVVISDNASGDNTAAIVKEFQNQFSNIRYFRNSENIGFDRNVLKVVEEARGEYCWFLGDDDALFEDGLKTALEEISRSQFPYYMANCQGYDHELITPALSHPNLPYQENRDYERLADFVREIKNYRDLVGNFGGMSSQIFKRSIWQNFSAKQDYIGSQAIHLHILLLAMKELPFMILARPLVKTRADNMRWETFPGLETTRKRREQTKKGLLWIMNVYHLPILARL